uniref:Uncharacterized protein n=1 Tax=Chromera velia CCMP2878 TaxID=1169474 RepID=A0A0G4HER2_9ALVE|eukprot:Cvel_6536.t1-p1 / transcript=Cvel_6536.t1 / gene=Cvel_6536 / organism=Chromera_velia_CCMP2878 / gene_product=hypothetical protein / transcript_product=hypothetical protein / location=Cvel_scaffold321:96013-99101(-) / protein_length=755 / sequence_SO=supercontig / SO=protein_coding / is_pseudo=false
MEKVKGSSMEETPPSLPSSLFLLDLFPHGHPAKNLFSFLSSAPSVLLRSVCKEFNAKLCDLHREPGGKRTSLVDEFRGVGAERCTALLGWFLSLNSDPPDPEDVLSALAYNGRMDTIRFLSQNPAYPNFDFTQLSPFREGDGEQLFQSYLSHACRSDTGFRYACNAAAVFEGLAKGGHLFSPEGRQSFPLPFVEMLEPLKEWSLEDGSLLPPLRPARCSEITRLASRPVKRLQRDVRDGSVFAPASVRIGRTGILLTSPLVVEGSGEKWIRFLKGPEMRVEEEDGDTGGENSSDSGGRDRDPAEIKRERSLFQRERQLLRDRLYDIPGTNMMERATVRRFGLEPTHVLLACAIATGHSAEALFELMGECEFSSPQTALVFEAAAWSGNVSMLESLWEAVERTRPEDDHASSEKAFRPAVAGAVCSGCRTSLQWLVDRGILFRWNEVLETAAAREGADRVDFLDLFEELYVRERRQKGERCDKPVLFDYITCSAALKAAFSSENWDVLRWFLERRKNEEEANGSKDAEKKGGCVDEQAFLLDFEISIFQILRTAERREGRLEKEGEGGPFGSLPKVSDQRRACVRQEIEWASKRKEKFSAFSICFALERHDADLFFWLVAAGGEQTMEAIIRGHCQRVIQRVALPWVKEVCRLFEQPSDEIAWGTQRRYRRLKARRERQTRGLSDVHKWSSDRELLFWPPATTVDVFDEPLMSLTRVVERRGQERLRGVWSDLRKTAGSLGEFVQSSTAVMDGYGW